MGLTQQRCAGSRTARTPEPGRAAGGTGGPGRRHVLSAAGGGLVALALASCASGTGGAGGDAAIRGPHLTWWDQFGPLAALLKDTFARYTAAGGLAVQRTGYNGSDQDQALQLAFSSRQLPDVFSLANLATPAEVLAQQGWFAPLQDAEAATRRLPAGSVVPGLHSFNGSVYSFPIFSSRQYTTLNWTTRSMARQVGLDPDSPPRSWDDQRAAVRRLSRAGTDQTAGIILPLKFPVRMGIHVMDLAQTAGFPGYDGVDLRTGEYRFHDDSVLAALDHLLSFDRDGSLAPASTLLDAQAGRARWVAGTSASFLDGPWNAGAVKTQFPSFVDELAVGPIPTPDGRAPVMASPPSGGTFWISRTSAHADAASHLLAELSGRQFQQGLAARMDQPPIDASSVATSDALDVYKKLVGYFTEQVHLAPDPVSRPAVAKVVGAMKPVTPALGDIVQGVFAGQIDDARGALRGLSQAMTTAREAAIRSTRSDVTQQDWAFPDWQRGVDHAG